MPNAQAAEDGIAFVTEADFPFGAWTSWLAYTASPPVATPFSVFNRGDIVPDPGSINPFIVGTPVLSPNRHYHLLWMPEGTVDSNGELTVDVAPNLADIENINQYTAGGSVV